LKSLDEIADLIKDSDKKIIIEGHTDNTPISGGGFESNWELASLRATSVVRYLIKYHKISPRQLAAISYADQKPIADNSSEVGRAKNRRIEVFITNEDNI
jgi:chemotaxis protein MotB